MGDGKGRSGANKINSKKAPKRAFFVTPDLTSPVRTDQEIKEAVHFGHFTERHGVTSFGRRATSRQVLRCSAATVQALAEGVRRVGKVDGAAVAHALRTGDPVSTVFGPVTFDAKGDVGA